ncbi:LexA family protein [Paenibacillus massiliensis]|uniref:LexA family protein n=1 Tax=Paenibacillus massiliensis TaxID=225917 RepID=UPI0003F57775|nr:hypothetical protein [Paenibacillus massiliensis]
MSTVAKSDQPLSRRQQEVYDFIKTYIEDNGYSPSIRDISSHFMMGSVSTAFGIVERLILKGYLTNTRSGPRTLRLTDKGGPTGTVSKAGIIRWLQQQMTNDSSHNKILSELQVSIESGVIR